MKKYAILCLLGLTFAKVNAQDIDDVKSIVTAVLPPIITHTVCSADAGFPAYLNKQLELFLQKDTTSGLSANEKQELLSKLSAATAPVKWPGNSVYSVPILPKDSVIKALGDSTRLFDYFKNRYPNAFEYTLYFFSKPIFIRNNTVCLFYFSQASHPSLADEPLLGDFSSGELALYIKTANGWTKKIQIFRYIT